MMRIFYNISHENTPHATLKSPQIPIQHMQTSQNSPQTKRRIACIGDSITELTNYPHILQKLLGENYKVGNFGACGTTISLDSQYPYQYSAAYIGAAQFKPEAAVVMLGTNDADSTTQLGCDVLSRDFEVLITSLQSLSTKPHVWVALPPPIFDETSGLSTKVLEKEVLPAIKQTATHLSLPTIDVYSALGSPSFFFDGVHPNGRGAEVIAKTVYRTVAKDFK